MNLSGRWSLQSCLIFNRLKCFGTMLLHVIIIYQCRMAVSINIATLLFSASHVQLARKIAAQTIHNHDKWQLHPWRRRRYQYWTQRFQCCSYYVRAPFGDGDEESWINNSSTMIVADLPTNAAPLLLPNLFTYLQAYIFPFWGFTTDTGNIQILAPRLPDTSLHWYPYGES